MIKYRHNPLHRNPGLPQGFIRFGSLGERILKMLHELGDMTEAELTEELGTDQRHTAIILTRLRRWEFVFYAGVENGDILDVGKAVTRYSIVHRKVKKHKPLTPGERKQRHRASKRGRVASVFDLRHVRGFNFIENPV